MTTFRENLGRLRSAQKPGGGVPAYTRWVNRRLARYCAAFAASRGLSANAVTAISAVFSLAGMVVLLLLEPGWLGGVLAAALLASGYVLDSADGQVARLTGTGGPAGEWLDHVVDAIRTPMMHITVALAALRYSDVPDELAYIALAYSVLSSGQFINQILAGQLLQAKGHVVDPESGSAVKSFVLLPNDSGTLCWSVALWGAPIVFAVAYTALFAMNAVHALISMRRKFVTLRSI